jgi:WhiB family transcriptional regulator, redox-sensing transcriptional regulator
MTLQGPVTHGDSTKRMGGIKAPFFDGSQLCAQTDAELFFPESAGDALRVKSIVKKICGSCEFQAPCLEYALDTQSFGIWGGTLETERRRMLKYRTAS